MEEVELEGESGVAVSDGASLTTYLHRTLEVESFVKFQTENGNEQSLVLITSAAKKSTDKNCFFATKMLFR